MCLKGNLQSKIFDHVWEVMNMLYCKKYRTIVSSCTGVYSYCDEKCPFYYMDPDVYTEVNGIRINMCNLCNIKREMLNRFDQ